MLTTASTRTGKSAALHYQPVMRGVVHKKKASNMFGLSSAKDFFFYIERAIDRQSGAKEKRISELFFIIMGLNHLREWIAPGYCHKDPALLPEQKLYKSIWELNAFQTINGLCNGTKHLSQNVPNTDAVHELMIDDWELVDNVLDFDKGPPNQFLVEGEDIENVIKKVADYYSTQWFK